MRGFGEVSQPNALSRLAPGIPAGPTTHALYYCRSNGLFGKTAVS